jgi:type I restriction enzyme M protein
MKDKFFTNSIGALMHSSPLGSFEAFELTLQILLWAKWSNAGTLPESDRLKLEMLRDPALALKVLSGFSRNHPDQLVQQAFSSNLRLNSLPPSSITPILEMAIRLNETGVLREFDPMDAIEAVSGLAFGEYAMPGDVASLLVSLAEIKHTDSVYVAWDTGGQLAGRAAQKARHVFLETPRWATIPALVSLLSDKPFTVAAADPIRSPSAIVAGKPEKFDVVVAFPPLNTRYDIDIIKQDWFERFPEQTQSGAVLSIRHLLSHSKGTAVVAVSNNLTFSTGAEQRLREDLVKSGKVHTVIGMPSGLLTNTNLSFSILLLDSMGGYESVRFINLDSPHFRTYTNKTKCILINKEEVLEIVRGEKESELAAVVDSETILENDSQLQVSRYVLPIETQKLKKRFANEESYPLGDLVSTVRFVPPPQNPEDSVEVLEVGAANLPDKGYISAPSRLVKVDRQSIKKLEEQFLRPNDIVLIMKGSVGKVGIVPYEVPSPGKGGWIANGSAIVLRTPVNYKIDPRALFMQLRSPLGQHLLRSIVSGASIPLIQLRELKRMMILIPDSELQNKATEALQMESDLQTQIQQLQKQQDQVAADLWPLE